MFDYGHYSIFAIKDLMKTSRHRYNIHKVRITAFTDEKLCVLLTMRCYILKTEIKRKTRTPLVFVTTFKTILTLTRWLK